MVPGIILRPRGAVSLFVVRSCRAAMLVLAGTAGMQAAAMNPAHTSAEAPPAVTVYTKLHGDLADTESLRHELQTQAENVMSRCGFRISPGAGTLVSVHVTGFQDHDAPSALITVRMTRLATIRGEPVQLDAFNGSAIFTPPLDHARRMHLTHPVERLLASLCNDYLTARQ